MHYNKAYARLSRRFVDFINILNVFNEAACDGHKIPYNMVCDIAQQFYCQQILDRSSSNSRCITYKSFAASLGIVAEFEISDIVTDDRIIITKECVNDFILWRRNKHLVHNDEKKMIKMANWILEVAKDHMPIKISMICCRIY